ncbi:MAG: hypothetical protein A2144_10715 [Chloroflexi bacterium RBG_16_50_9]|nr:MAG: hypothetical protein A2144_10715 [Chloroflexi bacterium RBG_16_50_9]
MFLGMYRPIAEVGFYNMAYKIPSTAIESVPFVLGGTLLPAISEQFGRSEMEKIRAIYRYAARYLMMLSFPLAIGGIALAKPIITLLYGTEYAPAILLMQIVFIPFAMRGLMHSVSSVIYGIKEPSFVLKTGSVLIVLSIGLNLWLIPQYGAIGAAIATSIPRMAALPVYIRFVSKKIGEPWPLGDTIKTALASVIMGIVVFALQHYLGVILGLCLSIPAGIIIYFATLVSLRVIGPEDLKMLKKMEKRLPSKLRRRYATIISLVATFVR